MIAATLVEAGLPADRLIARAQEPEIKAALLANTQAAYEHGAFGIPSFMVGNALYFGKDRLADVEAAIISQQAE